MAKNRSPQTHLKRQRERDKQMKRNDKIAKRHERNDAKRRAKADGTYETGGIPTGENPAAPPQGPEDVTPKNEPG